MRLRLARTALALVATALTFGHGLAQEHQPVNPIIVLLEQGKPVFGLYAPSARPSRRRGEPQPEVLKTPAQLAKEALAYHKADFLFNGSMERGLDAALPEVTAFVRAMEKEGQRMETPLFGLAHPLVVKAPKIAPDITRANDDIRRELNLGAAGIMFVEAESAEEVRHGIQAMRFAAKGGTRPDDVEMAANYWGMTEDEYRERADLWPLNPKGELINWTIVESKEGLANVREIAAVEGIGVLWPGAGTLRRVFTTTNAKGERVFDAEAHEAAIQQVLAACKEFEIPCGYPANASDIEARIEQGFRVFVMPWGERGFETIDVGRRVAGRNVDSP